MDYTTLFRTTFEQLGMDVVLVPNVFDSPYSYETGWPCKLPKVEFGPRTILIMHCQDFLTAKDGRIVELDLIADYYGINATRIVVTHMSHGIDDVYRGPINLISFSNHNYALMNRLHEQWDTWKHITKQTKTKPWQCLNGRECSHRRRAVDILQSWPDGILSYGTALPLPTWDYSTYRGTDNDENFFRLADVYGSCAVNIVTETQYDNYPGVICEKTLLAMLAQQIPIVIGHPGIIRNLRDLGFDVFDDVVDNSFDNLPNEHRVEQAILLNRDLILGRHNLDRFHDRLVAQREYALKGLSEWYRSNFQARAKRIAYRLTNV